MKIPIDRQAVKPVYLQIRDRFSRLIKSGRLKIGERLSSNGGLFLWVQLPSEVSVVLIARQAWLEKVFVYPGMPFFPGQKGYNALRLNFSHDPEIVERGIAILGKLLKQHLQK